MSASNLDVQSTDVAVELDVGSFLFPTGCPGHCAKADCCCAAARIYLMGMFQMANFQIDKSPVLLLTPIGAAPVQYSEHTSLDFREPGRVFVANCPENGEGVCPLRLRDSWPTFLADAGESRKSVVLDVVSWCEYAGPGAHSDTD